MDSGQRENVDINKYRMYLESAAFVIQDYLTKAECSSIIDQAEKIGMESVGYSREVRITDRVIVRDDEIAATLFRRAEQFLEEKVLVRHMFKEKGRVSPTAGPASPSSSYSEPECECDSWPKGIRGDIKNGWWKPSKLNPCFRVCRYTSGGHFSPHFDGGFDESENMRSIKTFMMYLNGCDEYQGGSTQFFTDEQGHYQTPAADTVIYNFSPSSGSCMVFNHHLLHGGEMLESGTKYIVRTEVMYEYMGPMDMFDTSETPWAL